MQNKKYPQNISLTGRNRVTSFISAISIVMAFVSILVTAFFFHSKIVMIERIQNYDFSISDLSDNQKPKSSNKINTIPQPELVNQLVLSIENDSDLNQYSPELYHSLRESMLELKKILNSQLLEKHIDSLQTTFELTPENHIQFHILQTKINDNLKQFNQLYTNDLRLMSNWFLIIFGLISTFGLILLFLRIRLNNKTNELLKSLKEGIEGLTEENFTYYGKEIDLKEFEILSESFYLMTEKLKRSYETLKNEINTRKRSEEALKLSEERFKKLANNVRGAIYKMKRPSGEYEFISSSIVEQTGYTEEDYYSTPFFGSTIIHPDSKEYFKHVLSDVLEKKIEPFFEYKIIKKNGEEAWLRLKSVICYDEQGNINGIEGVIVDCTDQKNAELALLASEQKYKNFVEQSIEAIALFDDSGKVMEWNKASEDILGIKKAEIDGICFWNLLKLVKFPPTVDINEDEIKTSFFNTIQNKDNSMFFLREYEITNSIGIKKHIRHSTFPVLVNGKNWLGSIIIDITEQKNSERTILQYFNIVEQMKLGLLVFELETPSNPLSLKLVLSNPFAIDSLQISDNNYFGKYITDIFPEMQHSEIPVKFAQMLSNKNSVFSEEYFYYDENVRPTWFSFNAFALGDNLVGILFENISERKKSEEQINQSLNEKTLLLSEIHHRVKNNLQVISSIINLQKRYLIDNTSIEILNEIQYRVQSIALVHEQLYSYNDFGKIPYNGYIKRLVFNIVCSIEQKYKAVKVDIEVNNIFFTIETAIPLGLIINELLTNSYKHAFTDYNNGLIRLSITQTIENQYKLLYSDNGNGFPEAIFMAESKTLGLRLISILAKQIYGTVNYSNRNGATFEIDFGEISKN